MPHSYSRCLIHYVFSTKERRRTISPEIRNRLWAYLGGIAREHGMTPIAIGGTDDHAHILVALPSPLSIAKAVQVLKATSSKWIHETSPSMAKFAWQEGYGAFSIGQAGIEKTIANINDQEAHHRTRSFEDEFTVILKRHGIEYDSEYVVG